MRPSLERLFGEYYAYHTDPTNVAIHKVAIPLIVYHVLAMLDWVPLGLGVAEYSVTLSTQSRARCALVHLYVSKAGFVMVPSLRCALCREALFDGDCDRWLS